MVTIMVPSIIAIVTIIAITITTKAIGILSYRLPFFGLRTNY
jgi:hypothetical protein